MKIYIFSLLFLLCLIEVNAQQAGFTLSQPSKCAPSTVSFTNTSTGNPSSYNWNFGDGFTSVIADPTHPYTNAGTYTVTLTAYYSGGASNTYTQTVDVLNPPSFSFSKLNDGICPGESISFTSSVTYPVNPNEIQSYSWDFGDGGSSSAPNPTYQYKNIPNQPVRYPVSLTVTDINGCSQKVTQSNYIYVKAKPVVDFSVDKQYFCLPNIPAVVRFTNQTTATTNNTYLWEFGDGAQSTLENPVHSYLGVGSYAVGLTVTSPEGCSSTLSKPHLVEVIQFNVQKTVSDTILCSVPNDVTFRGLVSTNIDYNWSFGDGSSQTSTYQSVTHKYTTSGTFLATVVANYRNGLCFAYDTMTIHVYDSIKAEMLITDSIMCDFEFSTPVQFENTTPYPVSDDFGFGTTTWIFGDGTTATGNNASHIYKNDTNRYSVTMQTTTPYGCVLEEITRQVWYHSYTPVNMSVGTLGGCAPFTLYSDLFTFRQEDWDSPAVTFIWDWGDGSPLDTVKPWDSLAGTPIHTYTDTGVFEIYLTFINEAGCPYTVPFDVVPVGYPPAAWFTIDYQEGCYYEFKTTLPLLAHAYDSLDAQGKLIAKAAANEWFWTNGNGNCPWLVDTSSTLLQACDTGFLQIRLIPYHNKCPGNPVMLDSVSYVCPPIASFVFNDSAYSPVFCGYPVEIKPKNISVGATAYKWFFGDAENLIDQSTDTAKNPVFVYPQPTPFLFKNGVTPGIQVTLVAYNDDSVNINSPTYNRCKFCTDTAIVPIYISDAVMNYTNVPKDVCQGNTVKFYDSGTYNAGISSWQFKFYPEDPANREHIDSIYPRPRDSVYIGPQEGYPLIFRNLGTYTSILTSEDGFHCIRYDTITFTIFPQSTASFTSGKDGINFINGKDTLCANNPDMVYIKDASYTPSPFDTVKVTQWQWKIQKDSLSRDSSTLKDPAFGITSEGLYDVKLRIANQYGCITDSVFKEQVLVNKITAVFYPSQEAYCNHTEVEFNNLSFISLYDHNKNTKLFCTWDWGDGSPSEIQTGTIDRMYHTYHRSNIPDTVYVTLTVSTADGSCSDTYTAPVIIKGPKANFTDNGHRFPCPEAGRKISFQNTSTGNPVWYYWNFGDSLSGNANESNLKDPIHDYLRAGTYDLTLVVRDSIGCTDTLFIPKHVFIDGPIGNFHYGELGGCADHRVVFVPLTTNTDTIIISPDRADILMQGGNEVNDSLWYTYPTLGMYLPYFYLIKWTDNNGTLERCVVEWPGTDTIFVVDIIPDFETDSIYCARSPIEFPNTTTLLPAASFDIDSTVWTFGNGDSLNAIDGYTYYRYIGTYTVNMKVYAKNCIKEISKPIEIIEVPDTIYTSPDSANACENNIEVTLIADSLSGIPEGLIPQYKWTFDDGEIIEGNPASRSFLSSGVYPYKLEITFGISNCAKTHLDTINIQVYSSPVAEFEAKPQTANFGEEIQFIDKSSPGKGSLTSWYWNFGDSTNSSLQNPAHTYTNTSGRITVLLKIEDEFGCKDSVEHEVLILESLEFPNIFSPIGSDGKRYVFRPLEDKGYFKDFKIEIYNRWGNSIWTNSCTNPNCPDYGDSFWWDGYNKSGELVKDGVYYWVVYATPLSGTKPLTKNGSVTVVSK